MLNSVNNHEMKWPGAASTAPTVSHDGEIAMTTPIVASPTDSDNLKRCRMCGEVKPLEAFGLSSRYSDGHARCCLTCRREYEREYHKRPEAKELRAHTRSRYNRKPGNKEKSKERDGRRNKEKKYARMTVYYAENRDILIEKKRIKREAAKKERQERERIWVLEHPEEVRERERIRKERAEISLRASRSRRRAQKLSSNGSFTKADIDAIRAAQGNRCYLCHKKLKAYHIDHFIPLSKGGTNNPGNLRLACPHCNLTKGSKHPFELGMLL
jgi:5-methylcytosine-specific restriction endonuclease McrA